MVSIEERYSYLETIMSNSKLLAFYNMVFGKPIIIGNESEIPEIDDIYFKVLVSISNNDEKKFQDLYLNLSRKIPNKDNPQPFIHNDLLIFSVIVGALKFNQNKEWIKSVVLSRKRNTTTITFENILNEDYLSRVNECELVITLLFLCNLPSYDNEYLNASYSKIVESRFIPPINDIKLICSLKAYDLIILLKNIDSTGEYNKLITFEKKFLKRTNVISLVLYNGIGLVAVYHILKIDKINNLFQNTNLDELLGVLGVTIFNFSSKLRLFTQKLVAIFLGYRS